MKCKNCGNEIIEGSKFCVVCGEPIVEVEEEVVTLQSFICLNCGYGIDDDSKFCPMCGGDLTTSKEKASDLIESGKIPCYCGQCGALNEERSLFCFQCGQELVYKVQTNKKVKLTKDKVKAKKWWKIILPVCLAVILGLTAVFGVISYNSPRGVLMRTMSGLRRDNVSILMETSAYDLEKYPKENHKYMDADDYVAKKILDGKEIKKCRIINIEKYAKEYVDIPKKGIESLIETEFKTKTIVSIIKVDAIEEIAEISVQVTYQGSTGTQESEMWEIPAFKINGKWKLDILQICSAYL